MNLAENIAALRDNARRTQQSHLKDVQYLARRAAEDDHDFLDKDRLGALGFLE